MLIALTRQTTQDEGTLINPVGQSLKPSFVLLNFLLLTMASPLKICLATDGFKSCRVLLVLFRAPLKNINRNITLKNNIKQVKKITNKITNKNSILKNNLLAIYTIILI